MCPNEDIRRDFLAYTRINKQELSKIVTSVERKNQSDSNNINDEMDENDERKDEIKESFDISNDNSKSNKNATKCQSATGNAINITPLSEDYTLETPTTVAESVQNNNPSPSERISTRKKPGLPSTIENVASIKHLNVSTPSRLKSKSSKSRLKYPRKPPMITRKYKSSDNDLSPNTNGGHTSDSSGSGSGGSSGSSGSSRSSSSTYSSPCPNSHRNDKKSDGNDEAKAEAEAEVAGGNTSVESICGDHEQKGIDSIITIDDGEQGERENECSKHEIVTPRRPKKPPLINTSNMLLHSYKLTRVNESPRKIFQTQPNSLRYQSEQDSTMNQEMKQLEEYENDNNNNNNNGVNKTKSRNKYRNGIEYCHRWTTSKSILSKKNDIKPVDVVITSLARNSRTIDEFTDAPKLFDNKLNSKNSKNSKSSKEMENDNNNGDNQDGPRIKILETRTIYKKRVSKNDDNLKNNNNNNNNNNKNKSDNVLTADMIENNIDSKFSFENSLAAVPYTLERYLVAHAQYAQSQTGMKQEMVAIPKIPPKIVPQDEKQSSQDGQDNDSDEYYPPLPK